MRDFNYRQYEELTYQAAEKYNEKDYKKALEYFLEMNALNPDNAKIHELLFFIYLKLGENTKAEREYQKCLALNKDIDTDFLRPKKFQELIEEAGDLAEKEAAYKKLIRNKEIGNLFPNVRVAMDLAFLYISRGEYLKAQNLLKNFKKRYFEDSFLEESE